MIPFSKLQNHVISRKDARAAGHVRYFTGKPCKRGHLSERVASNGQCLACARLRESVVRATDPDKYNATAQVLRAKNAARITEQRRSRRLADPEKHRLRNRADYAANAEKRRAAKRASRAASLELSRQRDRARYAANPESRDERSRMYRQANRERLRVYRWSRYIEDPSPAMAYARLRRAAKRRAVPAWFGELDELVWVEATDLVQRRREATGLDWHADHMLPLRAKVVWGLHTWNNCQVIPAALNLWKKNRLIFTMPLEWLRCL